MSVESPETEARFLWVSVGVILRPEDIQYLRTEERSCAGVPAHGSDGAIIAVSADLTGWRKKKSVKGSKPGTNLEEPSGGTAASHAATTIRFSSNVPALASQCYGST
jgi:hypothetical protein